MSFLIPSCIACTMMITKRQQHIDFSLMIAQMYATEFLIPLSSHRISFISSVLVDLPGGVRDLILIEITDLLQSIELPH